MSKEGLYQIVCCDKGTLNAVSPAAPVDPVSFGLRTDEPFNIEDFNSIKTYRETELRNQINMKIEPKSTMSTMYALKKCIKWAAEGFDAQVTSSPQNSSRNQDCWKMIGDNFFGLGFEAVLSSKERYIKPVIERSMPYEMAKTFIDSADTERPVAIAGLNKLGDDYSQKRSPFFLQVQANGSNLVEIPDLIERKLTIKTVGDKDDNNADDVNWIYFLLELKSKDCAIADIMPQLNLPESPTVIIKESNGGGLFDCYNFASGSLTPVNKFEMGSKRNRSIKLAGRVSVFDPVWTFGTGNGGQKDDGKGLTGGTMKIGY